MSEGLYHMKEYQSWVEWYNDTHKEQPTKEVKPDARKRTRQKTKEAKDGRSKPKTEGLHNPE